MQLSREASLVAELGIEPGPNGYSLWNSGMGKIGLKLIKFIIPRKENDEQFKSNLKNFYLLKNTSGCLHGSR